MKQPMEVATGVAPDESHTTIATETARKGMDSVTHTLKGVYLYDSTEGRTRCSCTSDTHM